VLGGRLRFSDGSIYEGFLHKGRRFGPGRYTPKGGKPEEGIWMLDSLAIQTGVGLPKALFEPEGESVSAIKRFDIGGYPSLEFKDAGEGWVYAFYSNILYLGKMENERLNGPGFMFTNHTYYTGTFINGKFKSGMKVTDNVTTTHKQGSATRVQYTTNYTDVIAGEFKNDQLIPSCAKMTRYDGKGNPVYMLEGFFYPSQLHKQEFADGWVYVNDWEGKRDAANLQYKYSGENYLTMNGQATYVSWFTKGLQESENASFCFPDMKAQTSPILALMKYRHDSVVAIANKRDADIAAHKEAWKKREEIAAATCATERTKFNYAAGDLYQIGEGSRSVKIMIAGPYNCTVKAFPVFMQNWVQSTKNTGYMNTATTNMSADKLKSLKKIGSLHGVCGGCGGKGSVPHTEYVDVGGSSGYTSVGGGWMVKNPETYWKVESRLACKPCSGLGFVTSSK
jgi:hypothetical protein